MNVLLLQYNKVHNESLLNIEKKIKQTDNLRAVWGDMSEISSSIDDVSYDILRDYVLEKDPDLMIIGDVFWETGQNLCKLGKDYNIKTMFLQHGQWIYIENKKKLKHYPDFSLMFGENVAKMCASWQYGRFSRIEITGSPRYDSVQSVNGNYIYFAPPVIEEILLNQPSGKLKQTSIMSLKNLIGIDHHVPLVIHPHYREARIDILKDFFPRAEFADPEFESSKFISGASKVLTSRNSTTVLDAIAHQKEAVILELRDYDPCFFKRGYFQEFATENEKKKDLIANLKITRDFPDRYQQKAKPFIFLGNASGRITSLISNLVYNNAWA